MDGDAVASGIGLYAWYPQETGNYKCQLGDEEFIFGEVIITEDGAEDGKGGAEDGKEDRGEGGREDGADDAKEDGAEYSAEKQSHTRESQSDSQKRYDEVQAPEELADACRDNVYQIPKDEIKKLTVIGKGAFGTVYRADWQGSQVAIKQFKRSMPRGMQVTSYDDILHEINIQQRLHHPNVVQLLGIVIDKTEIGIVTEYVKGSDMDALILKKDYSLQQAKIMAKQVTAGLLYLHRNSIVHQDLKPANILVTQEKNAKICDLGISRVANSGHTMVVSELAVAGSPAYMAPEVLINNHKPNFPSDIWSLGCTIVELMTGNSIWGKEGDSKIRFIRVEMKKKNPPIALGQMNAKKEKAVFAPCFYYEPTERPMAKDLCQAMSKWK